MNDKITLAVYIDDGNVYEYDVANAAKAREHASAILNTGFRNTPDGTDDLEWLPVHRIVKVVAKGAGESMYKTTHRAT